MCLETNHEPLEASPPLPENPFSSGDVIAILIQRGWLAPAHASQASSWASQAAALLGPQSDSRSSLEDLLGLIFLYDAPSILATTAARDVLSRVLARRVLREAAALILDAPEIDSARFKLIITELKSTLGASGRILFHPLRLALAGRAGEGSLDRVILLLDSAARLPAAVPVKGSRQRILEFCSNLD